ncbi:MAG: insulinase family protein, partial [Aggregatilineales bacterium]
MSNTHGFDLLKSQHILELNATATWYRHQRTGAELVSVETSDENKAFCAAFKTPPPDDTGLPHILEHSVLNGSRKYPVSEPFVELLKTSMQTFLNAMTMPDATVYPVASTNLQDFYNLVDVYLDAVFYPLITEDILRQEGWHHEVEGEGDDAKLSYKGVVFNEMKGYYSSADIVMDEEIRANMMPDTPYARSYGGNPAAIPDLTYEQFKNFHSTYYHPSNARLYFYGDDNPEERLRLIDSFLAEFESKDIDTTLPYQPRFGAPRSVTKTYDAGEADSDGNKTLVSVNWLLSDVTDTKAMMAMGILSHILVQTSASPLRKALIDSGMGEAVMGQGLDDSQREASFTIGLKGVSGDNADKVETLVLETLGALADNGIDKAAIESSMNTIEFQMRERNSGGFPQGLATLFQMLPVWMHGGDPLDAMAFEDELKTLKADIANNDEYFENLVGQYLLDNPHRLTVTLTPDPQVKVDRAAAEEARLVKERAAMSEAALDLAIEQAENLEKIQNTPDSPEALATLPILTLNDLERNVKSTPIDVHEIAGTTVLYHDLPANGVVYMDMALDISVLPQAYLPYMRLFGRALTEMGTESQSFVELAQRIGSKTGGVRTSHLNMVKKDRSGSLNYLMLRAKAMYHQTDDMLAILTD